MSKGQAKRGSQKDIQLLFNVPKNKTYLERKIKVQISDWLSPIESDDYREYQDDGFLNKIGLGSCTGQLVDDFWPKGGPVWDGLAKSHDGTILLFEAKAHISEMFGGGMKAKAKASRDMILRSLEETAEYIRAGYDATAWTDAMYQTANRLAHLYFLNKKIGVKAKLIYLVFLNDDSILTGKETEEMWRTAINVAERYILKLPFGRKASFNDGTNGSWHDWVSHVFIDVKQLSPAII